MNWKVPSRLTDNGDAGIREVNNMIVSLKSFAGFYKKHWMIR